MISMKKKHKDRVSYLEFPSREDGGHLGPEAFFVEAAAHGLDGDFGSCCPSAPVVVVVVVVVVVRAGALVSLLPGDARLDVAGGGVDALLNWKRTLQ